MYNKNALILLIFSLVFNCTVTEAPQFVGLDNIRVVDTNLKRIKLSADALFLNPNDVGGTLKTDNINIYVNDTEVAFLISDAFEVPSKESFTMPLTVAIATDSIIDKKSIGGLLGSLISQRLKVHYKGTIKYKVLGYSSTYHVDKTENIKIKL